MSIFSSLMAGKAAPRVTRSKYVRLLRALRAELNAGEERRGIDRWSVNVLYTPKPTWSQRMPHPSWLPRLPSPIHKGLHSLTVACIAWVLFATFSPNAWANCNPGRAGDNYGSHYQGGDHLGVASIQLAGVTIDYYTPYVNQGAGSSSSAWQMLATSNCYDYNSNSYILGQDGFIQEPGDTRDYTFYEYGTCGGGLYMPVEETSYPLAQSRFNVGLSGDKIIFYDGSTIMNYFYIDWTPNWIVVAAEVHNEDDQGYGGYSNFQGFDQPDYEDTGGTVHADGLLLTPNNIAGGNESDLPTSPWLALNLPGPHRATFGTYDTACPS